MQEKLENYYIPNAGAKVRLYQEDKCVNLDSFKIVVLFDLYWKYHNFERIEIRTTVFFKMNELYVYHNFIFFPFYAGCINRYDHLQELQHHFQQQL